MINISFNQRGKLSDSQEVFDFTYDAAKAWSGIYERYPGRLLASAVGPRVNFETRIVSECRLNNWQTSLKYISKFSEEFERLEGITKFSSLNHIILFPL